jgi:hypothetical protein
MDEGRSAPRDGSGGIGERAADFFAEPCPSPPIAARGVTRDRVRSRRLTPRDGAIAPRATAGATSRARRRDNDCGEDRSLAALWHDAERPEGARGAHARGSARRADARSARDSTAALPIHARGAPTVAIARRLGLASPARDASSARKCLGRMPDARQSGETRGFAASDGARDVSFLESSRASCCRDETRAVDARSRNATFEAGGGPAARWV